MNQSDGTIIEKYLLTRGLFEPRNVLDDVIDTKTPVVGDEILKDEDMLERISSIWTSDSKAITAVLKARMLPIIINIVQNILPQELTVHRQALVEMSALLDDFEKYSQEFLRRNQGRKGTITADSVSVRPVVTPAVEVPKETSL